MQRVLFATKIILPASVFCACSAGVTSALSATQTASDTEAALLSKFDISCNDGAMISRRISDYENGKVLRQFVVNDTGVVEYFKDFSNGTGDLANGVGNKFENGKFIIDQACYNDVWCSLSGNVSDISVQRIGAGLRVNVSFKQHESVNWYFEQCKLVIPVTQVNPRAFNAYNLWMKGSGRETLEVPYGHASVEYPYNRTRDGVFNVPWDEFFANGKFVATPTSGASVENDLLVYPAHNHRQLKLNFDVTSTKAMNFAEALSYCKAKEMRLPTVRELFDFCAAGVTEPNYGPDFRRAQYPKDGRCRENFWSVTRGSLQQGPSAWIFYKPEGSLLLAATYPSSVHARCVF